MFFLGDLLQVGSVLCLLITFEQETVLELKSADPWVVFGVSVCVMCVAWSVSVQTLE